MARGSDTNRSSSAAKKAQQRPEEFEESHDKFPDALELIPVRDTHECVEDHVGWGHCTVRNDRDRNGGRQSKRNSGSRFMTRMIAATNCGRSQRSLTLRYPPPDRL